MEPPSAFRLPPRDLQQPLLPLSPERVNSRPSPTRSRRPDRDPDQFSDAKPLLVSQSCSPTRKANLFVDYAPLHTTPTKSSAFGPGNLPQSPSLPEFTALRTAHVRTNSDVQGLVKRFETLDVRDKDGEVSALRKRAERAEMELQRAQVGREEAESEGRKLRQETKELQERDRRWARRLEKVEADAKQDRQTAEKTAENFQHAMRKKQSEVLKSGQKVLDLQTEFHKCQKKLEVSKMEQARCVEKAQRSAEEAMDAKNALSIRIVEYARLEAHCQTAERENEVLKIRMDERQLVEAAAEGAIALPGSMDEDEDLLGSPRKVASPRKLLMRSPLSDDKENTGVVTKKMLEMQRWQDEAEQERMKREAAEDMVDFLRMECAFQCCDCALAAKHGRTVAITMGGILETSMQRIRADMQRAFSLPTSEHNYIDMDADIRQHEERDASREQAAVALPEVFEKSIAFEPARSAPEEPEDLSTTLAGDAYDSTAPEEVTPAEHHPSEHAPQHEHRSTHDHEERFDTQPEETSPHSPYEAPATPTQSPRPFALRTITTTTQIPMHFTPVRKPNHPFHPEDAENIDPDCAILDPLPTAHTPNGTLAPLSFDREAALAAIAYRRGRAKSLANGHLTPRKQMVEGLGVGVEGGRRDVSAPILGRGRVGTVSPIKGGSVGRAGGRAGGMGM
ncbi:hypothetical protein B0A48_16498 [Cryoendolithus antarcticus]|uniref:Uncharacterized protein n=1 Tax=Cryoendolithus antarcticus TaxID=1507870 RepID=A0A1V8SEQ9_9PEZI|nr:hypothetical protein B0A48_16498 [Cryoendolithus antarcticus]